MSLWDNFRDVVNGVEGAGNKVFEVVGNLASGAVDKVPGGKQFFDTYNDVNNAISQSASWTISALPGGIDTFTGDQARKISPGSAAAANAWGPDSIAGGLINAALDKASNWHIGNFGTQNPEAASALRKELQHKYLPFTERGYDVTNDAQRTEALSNNPMGKVLSGSGDGLFSWYADAGVIGGKLIKTARVGSSATGMGLTDRTIRTAEDARAIASEIDDHVLFRKSGGTAGKETAAGLAVERTVTKDPAAMLTDPLARRSNNKGLIASLLGESSDLETSALVVKAGIGDVAAMDALRTQAASTADALDRAMKLSESAQHSFTKPIGELDPTDLWVQRPELANRLDAIVEDLTVKDNYLQNALSLEVNQGTISKIGSASTTIEKARTSFLNERTNSKLDPNGWVTDSGITGPQFVERVFQRNDYVRPVRVLAKAANWVEGQRPAGWIALKGQVANDAADELWASLTNSPTLARNAGNVLYRRDALNKFMVANNPTARMQAVTQLEQDASQIIANRYGISKDIADTLYSSYNRARQSATDYLSKRGYLVDTDGSIIMSPVLSSQLADGVPMMDFRVYEDLIRRHQNALVAIKGKSGDAVRSVLEPIWSAWKSTVLFRMGYTIRNVTEGNLRAGAAYGVLPAFADPFGSMKRFAQNDVRRGKIAGNYARELLMGQRPKEIRAHIENLRDAQKAQENLLDQINLERDYIRLHEMPEATGVDTLSYKDFVDSAADHGTQFNIADLEANIGSPTASLLPTRQRQRFLELHAMEQDGTVLTGSLIEEYRHLRAKASRTRLRELQATGQEIVVKRGDSFSVVKNVRELSDEDLVPLTNSRRGAPGKAIEDESIPLGSINARVKPRQVPEVYVTDRWRSNIKTANSMGETVPGRVAKEARVRNPKPIGRYYYSISADDSLAAQSAIAQIAKIEEQLSDLYGQLDSAVARRKAIGTRKRLGDEDVFSGQYGAIARANASADSTYEAVIQDMMSQYEIHSGNSMNSWGVVNPTDKQYFNELAHVANYQFKNDDIAKRILAGETRDDIIKWVRSDEARTYRRDMDLQKADVPAHVDKLDDMVTSYIPSPELRAKVLEGDVQPLEFEAALSRSNLVPIHGRQVEQVTASGNAHRNLYRQGIAKIYRLLGSAPEDLAVRHPFYRSMNSAEQQRLTQMYLNQGREITPLLKEQIGQAAHAFALKETKRTLYTIERYSNPAMVLRWVVPFFPAYENTMKTWLRIGLEDPSVIARANLIWNAPNEMGLVVDQDGNRLAPGATFDKQAYVVMPDIFAKALAKIIPGGQVPSIPKGSLNFVLPGSNPFLPGVGFTVAVPVNQWIASDPEREGEVKDTLAKFFGKSGAQVIYEQFVPFGAASADPADVTLASSLKQAGIRIGAEGNADFMVRALGIYRDQLQGWHDNAMKGPKPTPEQAIEKAKSFSNLRIVSALTAPFALRWQSPYSHYIEEYRNLTTKYGFTEGEAMFDEKYPEYATLKLSLTSNPTGMSSSLDAYKVYKANTPLWNDLTSINNDPKYGQLLTNPVGRGEFNSTVYNWMKGRPIAPGSNVVMKGAQTLVDFQREEMISRGWSEYRKAKAQRDAWVTSNGYPSYDAAPQEVKDVWKAWMAKAEQENPEWYSEKIGYSNEQSVRGTITALTKIATNDKYVKSSPDKDMWLLVRDYLEKRQAVVDYLAGRKASGGSNTIDANSNSDVAEVWSAYVTKLVDSNTKFADLYNRWLDSDGLTNVTVN